MASTASRTSSESYPEPKATGDTSEANHVKDSAHTTNTKYDTHELRKESAATADSSSSLIAVLDWF
jgi:hypothetical protein